MIESQKRKLQKIISDSKLVNELYLSFDEMDKGIFVYGLETAYNAGFKDGLIDYQTSCKHSWYRTTMNYKSVRKCSKCGEIKTS